MTDLRWVDAYIGIPSADANCWDLVRHVYREHWRMTLADPPRPEEWQAIPPQEARLGDVVLFHTSRDGWHVGLVVWRGHMLHTPWDAASHVEHYERPGWQHRCQGVYRYTATPVTDGLDDREHTG
jgi:cell wall-associated NlpC family hydrolase